MTTLEDLELLRRYATDRSEAAFGELVRRHVTPVYAFALRRVGGDAHLAEDVTQMVFTALARKASSLTGRQTLGGWLCRTTHFAARDVVRVERRRRAREQEAQTMHESPDGPGANIDWEKLQPVLNETMGELNDDDRDAVWLRFFEGRSFAEVGARLRLTENAARMRVERALDKLHGLLAQRGATSTTAALGLALTGQATVAAPAGLAASITGVALAGTAASSAGWLTIFMGMSKLQIGITSALAVAGASGYFLQAETNAGLRREIAEAQAQQAAVAALHAENRGLASAAAEVELLRRDDEELKRLAEAAVVAKKAVEENAKRLLARSNEQNARDQIDRMNREGNALVMEYKVLTEKSQDPALSAEAKTDLQNAAQQKLEAIKAKQREVSAFTASARASGAIDGSTNLKRMTVGEQNVRAEMARIMGEANALAGEYKALTEKSQNSSLSVAEKEEAGVAAQAKQTAIQAKMNEVRMVRRRAEDEGILPPSIEGTIRAAPGQHHER
jgi:RNA polymerase sigma factor (sigma-70 family)